MIELRTHSDNYTHRYFGDIELIRGYAEISVIAERKESLDGDDLRTMKLHVIDNFRINEVKSITGKDDEVSEVQNL